MGLYGCPMPRVSEKLTAELAARNMGYRTLAKLIDPENVEQARRSLRRWANGTHVPSRANRDAITDALGLDRGALEPDDEEDSPVTPEEFELLETLYLRLRPRVRSTA